MSVVKVSHDTTCLETAILPTSSGLRDSPRKHHVADIGRPSVTSYVPSRSTLSMYQATVHLKSTTAHYNEHLLTALRAGTSRTVITLGTQTR